MLDAKEEAAALETCESEAIRTPDRVQPHGAVLVCDIGLGPITHLSAHVADIIPGGELGWLGQPMSDVLAYKDAHALRNALSLPSIRTQREYLGVFQFEEALFQAAAHVSEDRVILELFPTSHSTQSSAFGLDRMRWLLSRQSSDMPLDMALQRMVKDLQRIVGFDRVMAYRFRPDGSGEVLAESRLPDMDSFVGLRFPAQDIPQIARAICLEQPVRVIGDTRTPDVPLLAMADQDAPVNLTLAELRGTSPVHMQYLQNMGVGASLVLPIVTGNALWGLFSCHHKAARVLSIEESVTYELVGKTLTVSVDGILRRELSDNIVQCTALVRALERENRATVGTFFTAASWDEFAQAAMTLLRSDGICLVVDGLGNAAGLCPETAELAAMEGALRPSQAEGVATTDRLAEAAPIAGAMRLTLSDDVEATLWLFRREENEAVQWAGSPRKDIEKTAEGTRLHPRSSFKAYEEMSEGASRAWEPEDIQLAQALQTSLRRSVSHELERSSNETRLLLMVQELNHRVRNVLSMMQSIAQQSKVEGIDIDEYADTLRQRLLALATAHDLLAQTDNAGLSLKDAITLELAPFASQVTQIEGPDLRLAPNAATLVVLVLHEIVTNAAKYGGFSTPSGRARVQWGLEADVLVLRWREEGSPAKQGQRSQGFGTFLIQKGVSHQLGGQAEMAFGDGWGEVTLRIPKSVLLADQPPQSTVGAEQIEALPGIQGGLAMERVLVVEDNFLVAAEVEDVLKGLGIKTVLLAANNAEAQNLIAQEVPDFALLDVNLGAEDSEPTAKVLEKSDIPFIFLTGYADDFGWLSGYENRGILNKPLRPGSIQIALERSWAAAKGS